MPPALLRAAAAVCLLVGSCVASAAQTRSPPTEIAGRVTDTSGSALAGVSVTADCARGQLRLSAHTSKSGDYRLSPAQPGPCRLVFTLTGYRIAVRDAVTVEGRAPPTLNVGLDPRTTLGATFTRDRLDDIPTATDPWAIMNQTAAVVMTGGVNVGGSASGQQLSPAARGQALKGVTWMLDGAAVTDLAAIGASPLYYDFGSFERIDVTTGGGDVSQQASGVAIRLVTRSGTNATRGSVRGLFSNSKLESSNITPALFAAGTGAGVPLTWFHEYGAEAGGPLVRNRLWWWAGSGVQDINGTVLAFYQIVPGCPPAGATFGMLSQLQSCLAPDHTRLTTVSGNARLRLSASHSLFFSASWSDKTRNARQASSLTAIESTARQSGSSPRFALQQSWTVGGRLVFDNQVSYTGQNFVLGFQTPDLAGTQVFFDTSTGITSRSLIDATTNKRPTTNVSTDGTLTLGRALGGEHALKFGVGYRRSPVSTYTHTGGNAVARYNGTTPASARLYRDGIIAVRYDMLSAYVQHSWRLPRLLVAGGVRWDLQNDRALAESVPANLLAPLILPAATFGGADPPVYFSDVAPRVSASYDLTGKGTTVVSGSYGIYFGQGMKLARGLSLTGEVTASFSWSDSNHDRIVDPNEIEALTSVGTSFNTATGLTFPLSGPIDPTLRNSRTRETVVGVDHQLARDLSVSASYIHRIDDRYIVTTTQGATQTPANQTGHYSTYQGVDVAVRKRFGNRWMLNAAYTRQSSVDHWPAGSCAGLVSTGCVTGTIPVDIDALDGRPADLVLPRFVAKLNGRVVLPWGFGMSATANVQDGFIRNIVINVQNPNAFGLSTQVVGPQGTTRYRAMTMIDFQVDRSVRLRGRARLTLSVVAFNLLNSNTVYSQANNQSLTSFGKVFGIVGPRVLRFAVTAAF